MHKKAQKAQKSTKSTKEHKKETKQKHKTQMSEQKLKMCLKNILGEKSNLFAYLRFFACEEKKQKSLYNGNVDPTKLIKVLSALYEQKLVY